MSRVFNKERDVVIKIGLNVQWQFAVCPNKPWRVIDEYRHNYDRSSAIKLFAVLCVV